MLRIRTKILLVFILIFSVTLLSKGQNLSAPGVMKKNDKQLVADDEYFRMTMTLINKQGGKRVRGLEQFTKTDASDNRSFLIKFSSPADIKGTGLLTIEHTERADDIWLYLPAFNKTRRISSNNESDYFVGSDFTFEDLNREDIQEITYEFMPEITIDGAACYQIKAVPKTPRKIKESGYSKRVLCIRKDNFVLIKASFYDKSGQLLKEFTANNVKKIEGTDKWRACHMEMYHHKNAHKTLLNLEEIIVNQGLDDQIFTERYLQK